LFVVSLFDTVVTVAWLRHCQASLPLVRTVFCQHGTTR